MADELRPITVNELASEVEFGVVFNSYCETFFRRVDLLLNGVQLIGGSAAFVGVTAGAPLVASIAVLCVSACAFIALLVGPGVQAERYGHAKRAFYALQGRCRKMELDALIAELADIRGNAPNGFGPLSNPAYNHAMGHIGRPEAAVPVSRIERLFAAFV